MLACMRHACLSIHRSMLRLRYAHTDKCAPACMQIDTLSGYLDHGYKASDCRIVSLSTIRITHACTKCMRCCAYCPCAPARIFCICTYVHACLTNSLCIYIYTYLQIVITVRSGSYEAFFSLGESRYNAVGTYFGYYVLKQQGLYVHWTEFEKHGGWKAVWFLQNEKAWCVGDHHSTTRCIMKGAVPSEQTPPDCVASWTLSITITDIQVQWLLIKNADYLFGVRTYVRTWASLHARS
jgi:hypothetical protein